MLVAMSLVAMPVTMPLVMMPFVVMPFAVMRAHLSEVLQAPGNAIQAALQFFL